MIEGEVEGIIEGGIVEIIDGNVVGNFEGTKDGTAVAAVPDTPNDGLVLAGS